MHDRVTTVVHRFLSFHHSIGFISRQRIAHFQLKSSREISPVSCGSSLHDTSAAKTFACREQNIKRTKKGPLCFKGQSSISFYPRREQFLDFISSHASDASFAGKDLILLSCPSCPLPYVFILSARLLFSRSLRAARRDRKSVRVGKECRS